MDICVIGTGYVGLVVGTCFADSGNEVICVDIDALKIERLRRGDIPFYEPGLSELVKRNSRDGRLSFTTELATAIQTSTVCFIAVATPAAEDGSADLRHVLDAARDIGRHMNGYRLIVDKSTVPVGTADQVRATIGEELSRRGVNIEFDVASNPEFLKEGAALADFMKPDRVVVGASSDRARETLRELYEPFLRTGKPLLLMDVRSAEVTKYAANAMLATKISFINEIANFCELVGADVASVRKGIASDSRIGFDFLFPGVGYGGSCFGKDLQAVLRVAAKHGYDMRLVRAVEDVNDRQKRVLVEKILKHFDDRRRPGAPGLSQRTIGVWGLSFKPRTDDMREAPSIVIVNRLLELGATIRAHDPEAMDQARKIFGERIEYVEDCYEVAREADALVVVTEWNEFRRPNFERLRTLMRSPVVFDGRNIYEPREMRDLGFTYYGIGRPECESS